MKESVIKKLMASMKCDSCGQHYEDDNIDIIGHREDMWFLRVLCSSCQTQCLVAAVVKESKVAELVETEPAGRDGEVVDANDVLNMHVFLKDFGGNFCQLFEQK